MALPKAKGTALSRGEAAETEKSVHDLALTRLAHCGDDAHWNDVAMVHTVAMVAMMFGTLTVGQVARQQSRHQQTTPCLKPL